MQCKTDSCRASSGGVSIQQSIGAGAHTGRLPLMRAVCNLYQGRDAKLALLLPGVHHTEQHPKETQVSKAQLALPRLQQSP